MAGPQAWAGLGAASCKGKEGLEIPRSFLLSSFCLLRGLCQSRACVSEWAVDRLQLLQRWPSVHGCTAGQEGMEAAGSATAGKPAPKTELGFTCATSTV